MKTALFAAALLAAAPVCAQPESAPAPTNSAAVALAVEAAAHFEAGRYCEAVQAYRKAWRIEPMSELLYNIAYIHDRQLDDPEVARVYYRRYVRARDTDRETRLKAFERLDALDAAAERPAAAPVPVARTVPPLALGARTTPAPRGDGLGMRDAAWISLGVGAAAAAVGTTFALLATHSHSRFEEADDAAARRQLADEGEQRALLGDIGLGVGLAGLAVGGVLYLFSADDAGIGAAPVPGGASVGFTARF
ncbi:MAG: hypothetical protein H6706_23480 [Myxococcales bacterium]|nr:hypothetical protein [Myxococcales bacterium]